MRISVAFSTFLVAIAMAPSAARAGGDLCCLAPPPPPIAVYALPAVPVGLPAFILPSYGYVSDPWEASRPFYVVNQGGPIYFPSTFSGPYPSDDGFHHGHFHGHAHSHAHGYPYIMSDGEGRRYEYKGHR